jgi:hypothetical protein
VTWYKKGKKVVRKSRGPLEIAVYVFCPHNKITSQTIRTSGALVFLCTGSTTCPKIFRFIVDYRFLIVLKMFENAENAPKLLKKSAKI